MARFSPSLLAYLGDLAAHNDREWFTANKGRYEAELKAPLHAFLADLAPKLAEADPDAVCSDKSMFRIYRDTRFSKDKRPYKTHAGLQFPRVGLGGLEKGPSATGYYLHLEPETCFFAGGLWAPEPADCAKIRTRMAARAPDWIALRDALGGLDARDALVRVPKGYSDDPRLADDLRRKSYTVSIRLTDAEVCAADLTDRLARECARLRPLVEFLAAATG